MLHSIYILPIAQLDKWKKEYYHPHRRQKVGDKSWNPVATFNLPNFIIIIYEWTFYIYLSDEWKTFDAAKP